MTSRKLKNIVARSVLILTIVFATKPVVAEDLVSLTPLARLFQDTQNDGLMTHTLETRHRQTSGNELIQAVNFECTESGCASYNSCGTCEPTWAVVAPYVWMPAMKGSVGANGNAQSVDYTLSDLFDDLSDINGAAMGHVEVGKGRRGFIIDGMLMKLSPEEAGPLGGTINVEADLTILEAMGMYRLMDADTGRQNFSNVKFDLLGGARYYQVGAGLTLDPIIGPTISREQSESWVDLVIGGRTEVVVNDQIAGFLRADFGGFGIGTSSKLAWNLEAGVKYDCQMCPGSSLLLGYKILDIDEVKHPDTPQQFVFDVRLQGPFVALLFEF